MNQLFEPLGINVINYHADNSTGVELIEQIYKSDEFSGTIAERTGEGSIH